jgi:hypothetical protein
MSKQARCTDEKFIEVVKSSLSWAEVLRAIGLVPAGGNYKTVKERAKNLNLDTSHMTGKAWNQGDRFKSFNTNKRNIEDYLSNKYPIHSSRLKERLWDEGYLKRKCLHCGIESWYGQYSHLELDHIDGNNSNNDLSNLRILCANCHSLTETFRGRNIKK